MWCIIGSIVIITRYKIKIRQLILLQKRNSKVIRPDTFKAHLKTPCGQLIVKKALAELKNTEQYKDLNKNDWERVERIVYRKKSKIMQKPKKEV